MIIQSQASIHGPISALSLTATSFEGGQGHHGRNGCHLSFIVCNKREYAYINMHTYAHVHPHTCLNSFIRSFVRSFMQARTHARSDTRTHVFLLNHAQRSVTSLLLGLILAHPLAKISDDAGAFILPSLVSACQRRRQLLPAAGVHRGK